MQATFLLIGDREGSPWSQVLARALAPIGELQIVSERKAVQHILQHSYDIVIVDATVVDDVPLLVSRLRAQQPRARIVVATTLPTWRRAREAFQVGVMDYSYAEIISGLSEGDVVSTGVVPTE